MTRAHNRSHFYKYTSAESALTIISSLSLRWSSPLKFNDPFDHQIGFSFKFDGETLGQALYEEMERIVFDGKVSFKQPTLFSLLAIRLHTIRDRLPKDAFKEDLTRATREIAENFENHVEMLHAAIQEQLTHSRVLCVAEENDNVVMWSHYADQHRGVVLELRCVDEIDNTLLVARKVSYSREFPKFPPLISYVRHLTGEELIDYADLSRQVAFTKHEDWSYEKEWRVHMPLLNEPPGDGYSLFKESPRVFGNIYLGCRMADEDVARIVAAAKKHIPHAKVLRGRRSRRSFSLEFEET